MEKNDRNIAGDTGENNEETDSSEKLLVLPLGEESKKITQVITNDTAREIMELLAERSMSASDTANRLNIPLTTAKYNIENLMEAGLVKIERIKYSEKGRQVKIYAPVRKLIVVVPERTDSTSVLNVLKKYLGVIFAAIFASGLIELLTGSYGMFQSKMTAETAPPDKEGFPSEEWVSNISHNARDSMVGAANESAQEFFSNDTAPAYIYEAAEKSVEMPSPVSRLVESGGMEPVQKAADLGLMSHPGIWFLIGCLFIIIVLIITDYYRRNNNKKPKKSVY